MQLIAILAAVYLATGFGFFTGTYLSVAILGLDGKVRIRDILFGVTAWPIGVRVYTKKLKKRRGDGKDGELYL